MKLTDEVRGYLKQKIAEYQAAAAQAQAQANAQMGAAQALQIMLDQDEPDDSPKE